MNTDRKDVPDPDVQEYPEQELSGRILSGALAVYNTQETKEAIVAAKAALPGWRYEPDLKPRCRT